jgi:hypothetical protein
MLDRHRRRTRPDLLGIVGWVFADLLLGLAIVFLATQPGDPTAVERADALKHSSEPTTTTSPSATTTEATTTTTTALPPGVDSENACFRIDVDPQALERDDYLAAVTDQLRQRLDEAGLENRQAGIVLAFGVAQDPREGKAIAEALNGVILDRLPGNFGGAARRAFWDGQPGQNPRGSVMVNVYAITGADAPPRLAGSSNPC